MPHKPTTSTHTRKRRGSASFDDKSVYKKSRPTTEEDESDDMQVDEDMGGYAEPGISSIIILSSYLTIFYLAPSNDSTADETSSGSSDEQEQEEQVLKTPQKQGKSSLSLVFISFIWFLFIR